MVLGVLRVSVEVKVGWAGRTVGHVLCVRDANTSVLMMRMIE